MQPCNASCRAVAVIYYVVNMRATLKLGSSLYFDRTLWVSLVNEVQCSIHVAWHARPRCLSAFCSACLYQFECLTAFLFLSILTVSE
jgi:hypothetical protein